MKRFLDILLTERFVNLFTKDVDERKAAVDEVWQIIEDSYRDIGGIKGSGFKSKEDMVAKIPFWKLVRRNGKIVTVVMYKDKLGRKIVAAGTNASPEGKAGLLAIIGDDVNRQRAFGEFSDKLLAFIIKNIGADVIKKYVIDRSRLKEILGDKEIFDPEPGDRYVVKYPTLKDYFYRREIGGEMHTKLSFGTTGNKIITMGE